MHEVKDGLTRIAVCHRGRFARLVLLGYQR